MDFAPVEGMLHKYEMGLLYVVSTCSAHCRFCYREELISRKDIERQDGTVAKKGLAQIKEVTDYIRAHNEIVAANGGAAPETGREKLREVLLSGGDPMVLPNSKIGEWLAALAEAGVESIRLGTKEMAFYPERFDEAFLSMLDNFHETYPDVGLPVDDPLQPSGRVPAEGTRWRVPQNPNGSLKFHEDTKQAMEALVSRGWLNVENQAPIIKGINDDSDALRVMQRALYRASASATTTSSAAATSSPTGRSTCRSRPRGDPSTSPRRGLSGVETHARLSITHYKGKTEVAAVTNEPIPGVPGTENGVVIFKILRNALDAPDRGKVCIVGRNPDAIWFDDYEGNGGLSSRTGGLFSSFSRSTSIAFSSCGSRPADDGPPGVELDVDVGRHSLVLDYEAVAGPDAEVGGGDEARRPSAPGSPGRRPGRPRCGGR